MATKRKRKQSKGPKGTASPKSQLWVAKKRQTRANKRIQLGTTQDALVDFILTGRRDARDRGHDRFTSAKVQRMAETIETLRERDPLMFRAADYHDKLAVGTGIKVTSPNPAVDAAAKRIWNDNNFDDLQHQWPIELFVTGDIFTRVPRADPQFVPRVDLLPSSQIRQIATTPMGSVWYYVREWNGQKFPEPDLTGARQGRAATVGSPVAMVEDIPASEIVHTAINRGAKDLRGVSPLESMVKWSALYERSLESVWMLAQAKSFLAFHTKLTGTDANDPQVTALKELIDEQLVTRTDLSGQSYSTVPTGQFLVTSEGVDITPLNATVGAGSQAEELRKLLLMAAAASGTPEVFFGDGDFSNLASSATQANPFFKLMATFQSILVGHIRSVFRKAFDRLMAHGVLVSVPLEEGMTHPVDWLDIAGPDVLSPDMVTLGPALGQLVDRKMISRQRAAELMNEDWESIAAQIDDEKQYESAPGATFPGLFATDGAPLRITLAEDTPPDGDVATVQDDPRHQETFKKMKAARERMRKLTRDMFDKLSDVGNDPERIDAIADEWRAQIADDMAQMLSATRTIGKNQAAAEMSGE